MEPAVEFLNHLIGSWELTGHMGLVQLRQSVTARWVLGGTFVELAFHSVEPPVPGHKPYEAVYFIGYNTAKDRYVLHLLDTFGVSLQCFPGIGQRAGNSISFVFDYPNGPFTNRFTWDPAHTAWQMLQTSLEDGVEKTFAVKSMFKIRPLRF